MESSRTSTDGLIKPMRPRECSGVHILDRIVSDSISSTLRSFPSIFCERYSPEPHSALREV
jgi:hypothetical protein